MSALPGVHAEALRSAVVALVGQVPVYLDEVPKDPSYPYVVVESDSASHGTESLGGRHEVGVFSPSVLVAARSAATVRSVREKLEPIVRDGFVVAGRLVEVERLAAGSKIARDNDLVIPVWWCRDLLEVRSYEA